MGAINFLLQRREARSPDRLARDLVLFGGLLWLVVLGFAALSRYYTVGEAAVGAGLPILFLVTLGLALGLPLRQLFDDSSLHASLLGGRCYQEVLGTLLTPGEILDQLAWHSARTYLRKAAPWTALLAVIWVAGAPAQGPRVLLGVALWLPLSTLFVGATSYLAQQFSIYNAQLKGGFVQTAGDSLVGLSVGLPLGLLFLTALVLWIAGQTGSAAACYVTYLVLCRVICRALARAGIERLPHLQQRLKQYSRFWMGGRNRFLFSWSDNPIVRRERNREAGRVPGQWLGALLWQFPWLAPLGLLLPGKTADYPVYVSAWLLFIGFVQLHRAGHRCSHAIVGEVEQQTLEAMQNTRLRAREFLSGWLQFGALPLMLENFVIGLVLSQVSPLSLLVFCLTPLVGAAMGLAASCATNRQDASKRYSEFTILAGLVLAGSALGSRWLPGPLVPGWPVLLLLNGVGVFVLAVWELLRKIEFDVRPCPVAE